MVPLDAEWPEQATIGGVLAAGLSGRRRLRYGPVRDTLLEAHFVSAAGRLVKAGGPVVKNVSGYDLCRLLVGSLGTLGILAEVVLRCQPVPARSQWYRVPDADPFDLAARLYRASAILWDGEVTSVLLEGDPGDVADQARSVLGCRRHERRTALRIGARAGGCRSAPGRSGGWDGRRRPGRGWPRSGWVPCTPTSRSGWPRPWASTGHPGRRRGSPSSTWPSRPASIQAAG